MKRIGIIFISIAVLLLCAGCGFLDLGQKMLGSLGINPYLEDYFKVDGQIVFIAEYGDYVYTIGLSSDDVQIVHKIRKEPFELVASYPITGVQISEITDMSNNEGGWSSRGNPRFYGLTDSSGVFFICDKQGGRIWLNEESGTALYMDEDPIGNRSLLATYDGEDFYVGVNNFEDIRLVYADTGAELKVLSAPADKLIENLEFISQEDGDYLYLFWKNSTYSERDNTIRAVLPEIVKLDAAELSYWDTQYPYGGEVFYPEVDGEYTWSDEYYNNEGGSVLAPVFYFFGGNSDLFLLQFEGEWNRWYCYDSRGDFLQTFYLDERSRPILSQTENYLYGAYNNKLLKFRLTE